jgi:WD40 repeat protein
MVGLAPRHHHFAGRSVLRHRHAGERPARLAHFRQEGHADDRLSVEDALVLMSPDGQWLATSGADACVIWPFQSKDGPMGKAPRECGVRPARVSRVAFHPSLPIVALGYDDGWVLLCRTTDSAELLVRKGLDETDEVDARNRPRAPVSALAWDKDGKRLLFGLETGDAGLLTLPAA